VGVVRCATSASCGSGRDVAAERSADHPDLDPEFLAFELFLATAGLDRGTATAALAAQPLEE
ncbi:hypothetical protein, partial [Nocardioides sp. GCM10030258]|uniref:hypothetical protein n=1 Tax=unclassified Nocardioides TaxID=2615069 RepID=UPI00360A9E53